MRALSRYVLTALLTAALLLAPGAAPAQAADLPAIGAEQAAAIARSLLPVPAADVKSANLELGHWLLEWETPAGRFTADIDSTTGVVNSFVRLLRSAARPFGYTPEEARPVASQWLAKLAPDLLERLRPTALVPLAAASYVYTWELLEQGYPLRGEGVTIRIDGHTGDLLGYAREQRPHGSLTAPAAPPDPDVALQAYREHVRLVLEYRQAFRPGTNELEWQLVYRPDYSFPYVDLAGNLFDQGGAPQPVPPASSGRMVPPVAALPPRPAKPLSAAEAAKVAGVVLHTEQAPGYSGYQPWAGGDGGFWEMSWPFGAATVDAGSGMLISFNVVPPEVEGPGLTSEAAEATAIEFVRRVRPDLAGRLVVTSPADEPSIHFQVLKDGIPLNNRSVEVDVDPASRQVTGLRVLPLEAPSERFPFEDAAGILAAREALAAFLQQSPLELTWVTFERSNGPETKLFWAPRSADAGEVGAHSGTVMARGGTSITAPAAPADLAGHPARQAVELLTYSGIIPEMGTAFRPDAPAALADLTGWLQKATGRKAAPPGLPVDYDPAAAPSRQLFALWAVQAAGYGPVAAMPARIELPFADRSEIGSAYQNAAGLLAGLGIIPADRFEPNRPVTRGEAAQIIQGIITHLQEDTAP